MSIDFNKPVKTDNYDTGFLSTVRAHVVALAMMGDPTDAGAMTNTPTGARRFNASTGVLERFNGSAWVEQSTSYLKSTTAASTYAPLTGAGTSGTWGIGITGSAGSVAWTGVSGRPTALSAFTNDINASVAPTWANVTGKPTAVSYFSNDAGYITTAALSGYAQLASGPVFTGQVRGNSGTKGLGAITVTATTGTPTGGADGDFVLVY